MNKKTFGVAFLFFCASLAWFVVNVVWLLRGVNTFTGMVIPSLFFVAGLGMMWNEGKKKKRQHIADVKKSQIP